MHSTSIRPVTEDNWKEVIALKVDVTQTSFIEPNAESILESFYDTHLGWSCFGLYVDEQAVGFSMIGAYRKEERYIWLDRFMIDAHFQAQGWGTLFLKETLLFIQKNWKVNHVILSTDENNASAKQFYFKNRFKPLHTKDPENGEELFEYTF